MRKWFFLSGAVIAEVTGTLALKGALDSPALYILVGLGYVTAFVFLSLTLRVGMPLGIAYGIWGASGVALTAVLSLVLFAEPLTPVMITGIVFIMAGVILVEVGNRDEDAHPTEQDTTSIEGGASPTERGTTPIEGGASPTERGTTPTEGGASPTERGTTPTEGGTSPTERGTTPTEGGTSPTERGTTPTEGGTSPTERRG